MPRAGDLARDILVPAGKHLFVDSYLADGSLDIVVNSFPANATSATAGEVVVKHVLKVPEKGDQRSERLLFRVPATSSAASASARRVRVTWKNASNWSARSLVYSLTLSDSEEFPAAALDFNADSSTRTHTQTHAHVGKAAKVAHANDGLHVEEVAVKLAETHVSHHEVSVNDSVSEVTAISTQTCTTNTNAESST